MELQLGDSTMVEGALECMVEVRPGPNATMVVRGQFATRPSYRHGGTRQGAIQ